MTARSIHDTRLATDLSGTWRAHIGHGDLHQRFVETNFDDDSWLEVEIPGHWQRQRDLATSDGPILYRRTFEAAREIPAGDRRFLSLDGVAYYGDVWLDGEYLATTEGYFFPHVLEVTNALAAAGEHLLAIEVASPRITQKSGQRALTGAFGQGNHLDSTWNPGGLWRPVRLLQTGSVRIAGLRCLCTEATDDRGVLELTLTLDAGTEPLPTPVRLIAMVRGPNGEALLDTEREETLAMGLNELSWTLKVSKPPLWWPRRLGDQPLCRLEVSIALGGEVSDTRVLETGFREVQMRRWRFSVNGVPLFVMGSNQGPTAAALAEATTEDFQRDIQLALDANLDMLRIHAHVSSPELYEAADRQGLLLWQDLPIQHGLIHSVRKQALTQARRLVDQLGHHPSVALWCAHDEPVPIDFEAHQHESVPKRARAGAALLMPSWNRDLLDHLIVRVLRRADPTRPIDRHSGVPPGLMHAGSDSHLYYGWHHGTIGGLARALRRVPTLGRFVSEFGAQAVPPNAEFMAPERWPNLDWEFLALHHNYQREQFDQHIPPKDFATFDAWRDASQQYQAWLIQLQIEDLRRIRHRPTGGFCHFSFADSHPSVSFAVLDHERSAKPGYDALRQACRPVLAMLEPRNGHLHVVNEERFALNGAVVTVETAESTIRFGGDVEADEITYIGTIENEVQRARNARPTGDNGEIVVTLSHPEIGEVRNAYAPGLLALVGRH